MTWGQQIYFFPEFVLRIFIVLENPSSSTGFEPTNIGSGGKYDNH
jgi:hypothetical protein